MKKKKLAVIRPTLRHKKRYIQLQLLTFSGVFDSRSLHGVLIKALQKQSGVFSQTEANITIIDIDQKSKTILIRINKEYLEQFIASLFFAQSELGLLKIKDIKSTIKKVNKDGN